MVGFGEKWTLSNVFMEKEFEKYNDEYKELLEKQRKALHKVNGCYSRADIFHQNEVKTRNYQLSDEMKLKEQQLLDELMNAINELNEIIDEYRNFIK